MASFYLSYFIHVLLSNVLFFLAIKFADSNMKTLVMVKVFFDMAILLTLPLLMFMTSGICG